MDGDNEDGYDEDEANGRIARYSYDDASNQLLL